MILAYLPTLGSGDLLDHVLPHELFHIGSLPVTNHMVMMTISAVGVGWAFHALACRMSARSGTLEDHLPRGRFGHVLEVILLFLRDEVARPALGEKLTRRYLSYIWTTFFFILFCNVLGMIPWGYGLQAAAWMAGVEPQKAMALSHWQGTPTGNIAVTGVLALISMFMIFYVGIRQHGLAYFKHYAPLPITASPMALIAVLLVLIEILGAFIKPFALCMRLFANMLAGHLVLGALIGLIFIADSAVARGLIVVPSVLGGLAMSLLELFVAFLQAYIFTFLTVLFIAQGAVHEHDEHSGHEEHKEHAHPGAAVAHGA